MAETPSIPGYEIHDRLGAGGMGVVYSATRPDNNFKYAIKMLLVGRNAPLHDLARFRIEAEAYACLNHPAIIKIRDVGIASGCPFLAMDFAQHGALDRYLKQTPRDITWCVQTIRKVADALSHAHSRRIIHRDLKPANILIAGDHSPRVTDFGLVKFTAPVQDVSASCCTMNSSELDFHLLQIVEENKALLPVVDRFQDCQTIIQSLTTACANRSGLNRESFNLNSIETFIQSSQEARRMNGSVSDLVSEMTHEGTVLGSPLFMSPEQAQGTTTKLGPQTDVYGLGATLYYVLTRQAPADGRNILEVIQNVITKNPAPPHILNPDVSEDLSCVVMKSLEKQVTRRYATMEMFGEDLDRVLNNRTPLARLQNPSGRKT